MEKKPAEKKEGTKKGRYPKLSMRTDWAKATEYKKARGEDKGLVIAVIACKAKDPFMSAREVAREVGMPHSTVYRWVKSLEKEGYILPIVQGPADKAEYLAYVLGQRERMGIDPAKRKEAIKKTWERISELSKRGFIYSWHKVIDKAFRCTGPELPPDPERAKGYEVATLAKACDQIPVGLLGVLIRHTDTPDMTWDGKTYENPFYRLAGEELETAKDYIAKRQEAKKAKEALEAEKAEAERQYREDMAKKEAERLERLSPEIERMGREFPGLLDGLTDGTKCDFLEACGSNRGKSQIGVWGMEATRRNPYYDPFAECPAEILEQFRKDPKLMKIKDCNTGKSYINPFRLKE